MKIIHMEIENCTLCPYYSGIYSDPYIGGEFIQCLKTAVKEKANFDPKNVKAYTKSMNRVFASCPLEEK